MKLKESERLMRELLKACIKEKILGTSLKAKHKKQDYYVSFNYRKFEPKCPLCGNQTNGEMIKD